MPVRSLLACLAASAALLAGCRGAPRAEDLAARAPVDTRRELLAPTAAAVIASGEGPASGELPNAVALGRASTGDAVLLLRFASTWREDADIEGAFLLFSPVPGARPATGDVSLEVARIVDDWSPNDVSWGRRPRTSLPELATVLAPRLEGPLRVDVTRLVRAWGHEAEGHGIALLASGADPFGAAVSMGVTSGVGPRLEVYLR